jgi:hypothetical protein
MPDDPKDVVEAAIRSAFVSYPKEDDPDWRDRQSRVTKNETWEDLSEAG